jgi:hypothetical protein
VEKHGFNFLSCYDERRWLVMVIVYLFPFLAWPSDLGFGILCITTTITSIHNLKTQPNGGNGLP